MRQYAIDIFIYYELISLVISDKSSNHLLPFFFFFFLLSH